MSWLSKLEELVTLLKQDENIVRFKQLEHIIDTDETLKKEFNLLKDLQKKLVKKQHLKIEHSEEQRAYDEQYKVLENHYLMSEYLDLLEAINNDLQFIKDIITNEINMEFDK